MGYYTSDLKKPILDALEYLHNKKGLNLQILDLVATPYMMSAEDPLGTFYLLTLGYEPNVTNNKFYFYPQHIKLLLSNRLFDDHPLYDDPKELEVLYQRICNYDYVVLRLVDRIYHGVKQYI